MFVHQIGLGENVVDGASKRGEHGEIPSLINLKLILSMDCVLTIIDAVVHGASDVEASSKRGEHSKCPDL